MITFFRMSSSFDQLIQIMAKLRGPNGCPWDHQQTHESIVPQLIEETYETISAIDDKNYAHLCEELGDLLLHIVFHSQMASERGDFDINQVIDGICKKLIRRHPHVFSDTKVNNASEVVKNWDEIKAEETKQHQGDSLLDSIPKKLPALFQAYKLSKKASKVGFDWEVTEQVVQKIDEEIGEFKEAFKQKDQKALEHEMGDLFFALANLARFVSVHPEEALRKSNGRFRNRFSRMEKKIRENNLKMENLSLKEWDALWEIAKKETL